MCPISSTIVWKVRSGRPAPILGSVTEEPVLDLVPLARPGWKVRDMDAEVIASTMSATASSV